jgi:hypothetical protein
MIDNEQKWSLVRIGLTLCVMALAVWGLYTHSPDTTTSTHVYYKMEVVGSDMREKVACEFEKPIKHLTLINHWYDTNAEMYVDYILLAEPVEHEDIWGWSKCIHQPEDSAAWCDVYLVKPDFVHADMNIDTIGHEVLHGSCGDFHG